MYRSSYNINKEKQYVEHVKKQCMLIENVLVDKLEKKVSEKSNISDEQKNNIKANAAKNIKMVANAKDDSTIKQTMQSDIDKFGLKDFNDADKFTILDAAYHVYSTKRKMGSGVIMSYLIAMVFLNNQIINYVTFGKLNKAELEETMQKIFNRPILYFFVGQFKIWLANILTMAVPPVAMILSITSSIQYIRFLFMLINKNAFKNKIQKESTMYHNWSVNDIRIHETYILYKKLNLL